ncbi:MAG: hypothetical protein WC623_05290 [Pedobacter sp.]|uniref:hypothetical protein n=1 Tax=Pedobacter sp. TaxID=1411316 RepID=UPI003569B7E8
MSDKNDIVNKGDRNKIYFLIIVIATLLGINAYLYIKDERQNERFVSINTEKDRLKLEVEKIEFELDKSNNLNMVLTEKLQNEQSSARKKIAELKLSLEKGSINKKNLDNAQREIRELRQFVKMHNEQIAHLKKENLSLKTQRDNLQEFANSESSKANKLAKKNAELAAKVKTSASLKAGNVQIFAYRVKSNGKNIEVTRASTAKKLSVKFNIVPNLLAEKNYHKIYLRIFDPAGNLIANENNMFEADGQEMQYTSSTTILYNEDNLTYTMDWVNPNPFISGDYSIILYADGFTMGKASTTLR